MPSVEPSRAMLLRSSTRGSSRSSPPTARIGSRSNIISLGGRKGNGIRPGDGTVQVISTANVVAAGSGGPASVVTGPGNKSRTDGGSKETAAPAGALMMIAGSSFFLHGARRWCQPGGRPRGGGSRRSAGGGSSLESFPHSSNQNGSSPPHSVILLGGRAATVMASTVSGCTKNTGAAPRSRALSAIASAHWVRTHFSQRPRS